MKRWTPTVPCPICNGHDRKRRGVGERCAGFLSSDGAYAYCDRPEYAGDLALIETSPPAYAHRLTGPCRCGSTHADQPLTMGALAVQPCPSRPPTQTSWVIRDVNGRPVAVHTRIDGSQGKRFTWQRPNGQPGLNGTSPVDMLYGVESLDDRSPGQPAIVVEGERAKDALDDLGVVAPVLATVCGATATPSPGALRILARRRVWLWPDNDDVGRQHMERIAKRLQEVGCDEIHLVAWGDHPGDDAADFAQRVGSRQAALELLRAAPRVGEPPLTRMWSQVERCRVEWLWGPSTTRSAGYVPAGFVTLLQGVGDVGKTHLCLALAAAVTSGCRLPEMPGPCRSGNVLYLATEDDVAHVLAERAERMGVDLDRMIEITRPLSLTDDGTELLGVVLDRYRPRLVVIDPLFGFLPEALNPSHINHARSVMNRLHRLAQQFETAIVAIRHLNKNEDGLSAATRGLGSVEISNTARSALLVAQNPYRPSQRVICHTKHNLCRDAAESIGYTLDDTGVCWTGPITITEAELLKGGRHSNLGDSLRSYVLCHMAEGPVPVQQLRAAARQDGIREAALDRAMDGVCVVQRINGTRCYVQN